MPMCRPWRCIRRCRMISRTGCSPGLSNQHSVPLERGAGVTRKTGIRWHLRELMAQQGMFATTDLVPLLAERGVVLSREQVYRLVTRTPERLNTTTLAALCDILGVARDRPGRPARPVHRGHPCLAVRRPDHHPPLRVPGAL